MQKRLSTKAIVIGLILCCAIGIGGTSVSWMGTTYTIPSTGETDWSGPTKVDGFLTSVASNALSKAGGNFTLTADANFGASFGLLAPYFSARTNAASSGFLRLDNGGSVSWRNAANSANLPLSVNSSNELVFNGTTLVNSSGILPVASGGTGLASYSVGDTLYASGATTLSKLAIGSSGLVMVSNTSAPLWQKITDAQVQDSAAISRTKLASGTADHVVINSAAGAVSSEAQLAVSRGGTNISSYTTGDLVYASGSGTLSKLGIGSTGQQLTVSGGVPAWGAASGTSSVISKTSNYTLLNTDEVVLVNSSGGSLALTLADAASNGGKRYTIKKTDTTTQPFSLKRATTDAISNTSNYNTEFKFNTPGEEVEIISTGSSVWHVTAHRIPSEWTRFTMNVTGTTSSPTKGTVAVDLPYWRRIGDSMEIRWDYRQTGAGSAGSGAYLLEVPNGFSVDTSKVSALASAVGQYTSVGDGWVSTASNGISSSATIFNVAVYDSTHLDMYYTTVSGSALQNVFANVGSALGFDNTNYLISLRATVPISGWEP